MARVILLRADIADRFRKRHKRPHPEFGSGTIGAAARSFERSALPRACDAEYLRCLRIMIEAQLDPPEHHLS